MRPHFRDSAVLRTSSLCAGRLVPLALCRAEEKLDGALCSTLTGGLSLQQLGETELRWRLPPPSPDGRTGRLLTRLRRILGGSR